MPFMSGGKRDYKAEKNWEDTKKPERKEHRAERNKARRMVEKRLGKDLPSSVHVDHKVPLSKGGSTKPSNLRAISAKANLARNKRKADGSLK